MNGNQQPGSDSTDVLRWADSVVAQCHRAPCTCVGLTCGSRQVNDRRAIDRLAVVVAQTLAEQPLDRRMLLVRLDVHPARRRDPSDQSTSALPRVTTSPLGPWHDVTVAMPVGMRAAANLERLPRWIMQWRQSYGLILIDLGPINQVPSRAIGRSCDSSYVLLGPDPCGSPDWITQHVAWHESAGARIAGSLVTTVAALRQVPRRRTQSSRKAA